MIDTSRYSVAKSTRVSEIALVAIAVLVVLLAFAPAFVSRSLLQDLFFLLTMIGLAQCWNLLAGYGGLVSVGQQAYVGMGAYIGFAGAILLGLNPLVAILLAGIIAAILSIPTAYVVFRLQGAYFAIGTWVVAEVYRLIFAQWKQLGGGTGTAMPKSYQKAMFGFDQVQDFFDTKTGATLDIISYWLALLFTIIIVGAAYLFLRT
ncbi:MAG: branched-chain amino acid ABC transporter permease, partial [Pseudomonadota bacterium]